MRRPEKRGEEFTGYEAAKSGYNQAIDDMDKWIDFMDNIRVSKEWLNQNVSEPEEEKGEAK